MKYMESFKRIILVTVLAAIMVVSAGLSVFAQETPQESSEDINAIMGEIFAQVGHVDLGESTIFTWWTKDLWAVMAYNDRESGDAIMGYYLMELMLKDHYMFAPISISGDGAPVELELPVVLKNDSGVIVNSDKLSDSFSNMIPGMLMFPAKDSEGRDLLASGTQYITIVAKYVMSGREKEYNYYLPIEYPDYVSKAKAWVEERKNTPISELPEQEAIISSMRPGMKVDFQSGVMVAPLTKNMMTDVFMERDENMKNNPLSKVAVEKILDEYSFYIVLSLENIGKDGGSVDFAPNAMVVDSNNKVYKLDDDEIKNIKSEMKMDESNYSLVIVPGVPAGTSHKLIIEKPGTGEKIAFDWN